MKRQPAHILTRARRATPALMYALLQLSPCLDSRSCPFGRPDRRIRQSPPPLQAVRKRQQQALYPRLGASLVNPLSKSQSSDVRYSGRHRFSFSVAAVSLANILYFVHPLHAINTRAPRCSSHLATLGRIPVARWKHVLPAERNRQIHVSMGRHSSDDAGRADLPCP